MSTKEVPFVFECQEKQLVGILHQPAEEAPIGVLIVVGGPQYRVGSHRQFLLLARFLEEKGFPVLRFDYRAMGDSEGEGVDFEGVDVDIASAIDQFYEKIPNMKGVVIWGLCDAASAALFYAYKDLRVKGLVLLNPWVRTESGEAKAYIKHYYLVRLLSMDFWKKILSGKWNVWASLTSFVGLIKKSRSSASSESEEISKDIKGLDKNLPLPERMSEGLERFTGKVLIILSGQNDYTACEFRDVVDASDKWKGLMSIHAVKVETLSESNHTFSSNLWRKKVELWTHDWLQKI